jgi:hypothetical protein
MNFSGIDSLQVVVGDASFELPSPAVCETTNFKPIARGIPRFSIPVPLKVPSSSPEYGVELIFTFKIAFTLAAPTRPGPNYSWGCKR